MAPREREGWRQCTGQVQTFRRRLEEEAKHDSNYESRVPVGFPHSQWSHKHSNQPYQPYHPYVGTYASVKRRSEAAASAAAAGGTGGPRPCPAKERFSRYTGFNPSGFNS